MITAMIFASFPSLAADEPAHVLPMWMQAGHPAVAISLDARAEPLRFIVDSAAGATLIDSRVVRRYGLHDPKALEVEGEGASAKSLQWRPTRPTAFQLGSWTLHERGLEADLAFLQKGDFPGVDGIIGNDLTTRWDTRWDFGKGELSLWRSGRIHFDGGHCQSNALPGRDASLMGFPFISMNVAGSPLNFIALVDTGAAQTILNAKAAAALGLVTDGSDGRLRVRNEGTKGMGGNAHPTWLYMLPGLSSSGWMHPEFEVRISDLPVFASLGLEDRPAIILGADVMLGGVVEVSTNAEHVCLRAQDASIQ